METKRTVLVEATSQNVAKAIDAIKKFADENGYQMKGDLNLPSSSLVFESKSQEKVCRKCLTRLSGRVTMSTGNKFLHFLFKKVYKLDSTPHIEYSEKELRIREARKAWKKAQAEAERLRVAYRTEKGDFYKKSQASKVAA